MSTTPTANAQRQAPTALLALVQHINDHGLGTPLSIYSPTTADPFFTFGVVSASLDAWKRSGLDVIDETVTPREGRIAGHRWERVRIVGTLQPYGLRVCLHSSRRVVELSAVPA